MSVSSRNKRHSSRKMDAKTGIGIIFSFFMLVFPVILPLSYGELTMGGGFPSRFFLAGAVFEFLLSFLLIILYSYTGLKRRRYKQMEYFLRIIIGLPLTILLAVRINAGFSVIIRFVFGILFFKQIGLHRKIKLYVFFFSAGMLLYSFLENYPVIRRDHVYLVITSVLFSAVLAGTDLYYYSRIKKILHDGHRFR